VLLDILILLPIHSLVEPLVLAVFEGRPKQYVGLVASYPTLAEEIEEA